MGVFMADEIVIASGETAEKIVENLEEEDGTEWLEERLDAIDKSLSTLATNQQQQLQIAQELNQILQNQILVTIQTQANQMTEIQAQNAMLVSRMAELSLTPPPSVEIVTPETTTEMENVEDVVDPEDQKTETETEKEERKTEEKRRKRRLL